MTNFFNYTGDELEVFSLAKNWKNYYRDLIDCFSDDARILEVGAGIGEMTKILRPCSNTKVWVCLEPDEINSKKITDAVTGGKITPPVTVVNSTFENFDAPAESFDLIMFIDSLEHIENDKSALAKAAKLTKTGGFIVILVPAHNFLYTEFDRQIGHFRRYNFRMLDAITPKNANILSRKYIDSIGFFLSLGNRLILRSGNPNKTQILFWDNFIVPLSRIFDKILFNKFGKNIAIIMKIT